ncbi:MAG: MG2 domain-containing protein, partial [Acidobacteria bacterium]|nr:MG2 domain-containing protein [Acidobacteriota bacterium]
MSEKDDLDFDKYTKEELVNKIRNAYLEVYKERDKIEGISLDALPDFLNKGDYPKEVLLNFRDFSAIATSNFFSYNHFYSPIESRTTYKLKVEDLLNIDSLSSHLEEILSSQNSHPLLIACAVLSEEEKNAFSKNRISTAIEFHARRSEIIFNNLTQKEDRKKIIEELKTFLEKNRGVEWYSWGIAEAAQFEKNLGDEECNIRARDLALKGKNAYPNSPGGQRCNSIITSIEDSDFNIETMHSDGTNLPSVRVAYKNLEKIYVRLIPVDVKELLYKYNEFPRWHELFKIVKNIPPTKKMEVKLKSTPDYNYHFAYVKIPDDVSKGNYICVASALDTMSEDRNKLQGCILNITETAVIISKEKKGDKLVISAVKGSNGEPISGVSVSILKTEWNKAPSIVFSGTTNNEGKIETDSSKVPYYYNYYLFAQKGEDKTFMNIYPIYDGGSVEENYSFILTDRSVYRVGQKIFFKVILFANSGEKGPYSLLKERDVDVELKDCNYESVQKISLKTNNYGSASGEFLIPKGRMLGRWQIVSSYSGVSSILVEEYKRPTFEVEIKEPISPLRLNNSAKIKGEAKYYFGMPVTSGNVDYTITRVPKFPWWCWWYSSFTKPEMIESGTAQLESDGTFTISFTPEADERLKDEKGITYTYAVSANVTDEGGETRGDEKRFNIGFSTVDPQVSPKKPFFASNEKLEFELSLKDLNGNPQKGKGTYFIYSVEPFKETPLPENFTFKKEKTKYSFEEDFIKPRWDDPDNYQKFLSLLQTSRVVKQGEAVFDDEGKFVLEASSLSKGIYRIKIEVKDSFG